MTILAECFNKNKVPAKRLDFHAGTPVFSEADAADGMYFIETGVVRITRNVPEIRREISLALLGPEEFFGIISCTMGKFRTADARAVTDCTLWQIDRETFREAVTKSPEFARLVIQGLIKRLEELQVKMRDTTEQMAEFTQRMEDLSTLWSSLVTWG
ncbi:MAG: cyclic nucleotide-binding domain-containing protein [Planctomycetota bacterium]